MKYILVYCYSSRQQIQLSDFIAIGKTSRITAPRYFTANFLMSFTPGVVVCFCSSICYLGLCIIYPGSDNNHKKCRCSIENRPPGDCCFRLEAQTKPRLKLWSNDVF